MANTQQISLTNNSLDHTSPANVDTNFATKQSLVRAKAGLVATGDKTPEPSAVSIRMNNNGKVFSVFHTIALQRVLQNVATLV